MNTIQDLLERRVAQVLPRKDELKKKLKSGKKLRVYQGFDPTGVKLHLGHSIGMRNLQAFAKAGHEVIVLFGTGTVLVGDPSERDTGRKLISTSEIERNIKTWKQQVEKIIDLNNVTIKYNGDWLTKLKLADLIYIASKISAVQLFKRQSFSRRLDQGDTVWYHETLYPLLQGYDSVVMDVDVEIGGTDQTFNMLVGRELQRKINNREKYVLTNPMILGTDGKQMSKSSGNCIWLDDSATDMYGKTMSIPDQQIQPYLRLLTDISLKEISSLSQRPAMVQKKRLAAEIVSQFHGGAAAKQAAIHFQSTVQDKQIPEDIPELIMSKPMSLMKVLDQAGFGSSNSERKRMIRQGGVEVDGEKIYLIDTTIGPASQVIKYGKRSYIQINSAK